MNCKHDTDPWRWIKNGFIHPLIPASSVYCTGCGTLLFTVLYDEEKQEHRIGFPKFHTLAHRDRIMDMFRNKYPDQKVTEA